MSSAWAFFQRFCLSHSVLEFNPEIMAFSALFLASKIEDEILPIQDLVEVVEVYSIIIDVCTFSLS